MQCSEDFLKRTEWPSCHYPSIHSAKLPLPIDSHCQVATAHRLFRSHDFSGDHFASNVQCLQIHPLRLHSSTPETNTHTHQISLSLICQLPQFLLLCVCLCKFTSNSLPLLHGACKLPFYPFLDHSHLLKLFSV